MMRQQTTIDKHEVWRRMTMLMKKKQSRLRSFRKFQGVSELSKASTRNPGGTYQGRILIETSHKIGHNPKYAKYLFVFPICFPPKLILYFQKSFDFPWTHVFYDCNMTGSLPLPGLRLKGSSNKKFSIA